MTYEIRDYPIPEVDVIVIYPVDKTLYYQKYRERLHSANIKNKIKWNRIRSNPNTKKGRIK